MSPHQDAPELSKSFYRTAYHLDIETTQELDVHTISFAGFPALGRSGSPLLWWQGGTRKMVTRYVFAGVRLTVARWTEHGFDNHAGHIRTIYDRVLVRHPDFTMAREESNSFPVDVVFASDDHSFWDELTGDSIDYHLSGDLSKCARWLCIPQDFTIKLAEAAFEDSKIDEHECVLVRLGA